MPAQRHKRSKNRTKAIGEPKVILRSFLLFAAIMLLFGGIMRLVASWQNRIWIGDSRVTFVTTTDPVTVYSYQESRELVSVNFPKNVQIDGAAGLGSWKLENLYELGMQKGTNGEVLVKSLQYSLNVPIDGYFNGAFSPGFPAVLSVFSQKSNFTFFDKVKIVYVLSKITQAQHKNLSAEKTGMVVKKRLGDGTVGFKLVPEKVKEIAIRELGDSSTSGQNSGIGIVNGTSTSRVGEQIAGITKTMGSQVLWVRSGEEINSRCILKSVSKTETAKRLAKIFSCEIKIEENLPAPIVFVIGPELARELPKQ